jgi:hypothetical protein
MWSWEAADRCSVDKVNRGPRCSFCSRLFVSILGQNLLLLDLARANRSLFQKVGQMTRVFRYRPLVGLRSKTSLGVYPGN